MSAATTRSSESLPLWEKSKENTAPLERGRNVAVLERALGSTTSTASTTTSQQQLQHERMIKHFEQLIDASENNRDKDPLIHWMSYIKYQQDQGVGVHDTHSHFLLLERCFRALCNNNKYSNDPRFVRICCMYADQTARPSEIFNYLYQQKIGTKVAIFWAAWAFVAEKQQDYPFAEKIFDKGIRCQAHPASYLLTRQKQFQRRMSRHWKNNSSNNYQGSEDDGEEDDDDANSRRAVLGGLSEECFRRNDRSRSRSSSVARQANRSAANPQTFSVRGTYHPSIVAINATNNATTLTSTAGFEILTDDALDENENNILDRSFVPHHDRVLEREQDRIKENSMAAERWNQRGALSNTSSFRPQSRLPLSSSSFAAPLPPFAVYVDEECAAQHERQKQEERAWEEHHRQLRDERKANISTATNTAASALSLLQPRHRDGMSEKLHQDPLLYIRNPEQLEKDQQEQERLQHEQEVVQVSSRRTLGLPNEWSLSSMSVLPSASFSNKVLKEVVSSSNKNSRGFNKNLLKGVDGGEQCFEEARIHAGCFKLIQNADTNVNLLFHTNDDSNMSMDDVSMTSCSVKIAQSPETNSTVNWKSNNHFTRAAAFPTPQNCSTTSSDFCDGQQQLQDPTINTQLALKELSMMFSSPAFALTLNKNESNPNAHRSGGLGPIANMQDTSAVFSEPPVVGEDFVDEPSSSSSELHLYENDDATATIDAISDLMADIERSTP